MSTQNSRESPAKRIFLVTVIALVILGIAGVAFTIVRSQKEEYYPSDLENDIPTVEGYDIADSTERGLGAYAASAISWSEEFDDYEDNLLAVTNNIVHGGSSSNQIWLNTATHFSDNVLEFGKNRTSTSGASFGFISSSLYGEKYVFETDFCWSGTDKGIEGKSGTDWYFALKFTYDLDLRYDYTPYFRLTFYGDAGKTLYYMAHGNMLSEAYIRLSTRTLPKSGSPTFNGILFCV